MKKTPFYFFWRNQRNLEPTYYWNSKNRGRYFLRTKDILLHIKVDNNAGYREIYKEPKEIFSFLFQLENVSLIKSTLNQIISLK